MKNQKELHRYLFMLPSNIYNSDAPSYELKPLPDSDQNKVILFAGKGGNHGNDLAVIYIYLELYSELTDKNRFANFQRILNLIYLETGLPNRYVPLPIDKDVDFDNLFLKFSSSKFSHPGTSYSGTAPEPNHLNRVRSCTDSISGLSKKNFERFDNSLNTYVWALELMELQDPHLKYTLYMTLFLSSIEQLVDEPSICKHKPSPICEGCGREFKDHHLKNMGNKQSTESFIREMLTGSGVDDAVERVGRLYGKLRSAFLHSGNLSGAEKVGGFLSDGNDDTNLIIEDMMNTLIINRKLLEQFLIKRQNKS